MKHSMIERLALHLQQKYDRASDARTGPDGDLSPFLSDAEAILRILREPTAEMEEAWLGNDPLRTGAIEDWRVMIDAALAIKD